MSGWGGGIFALIALAAYVLERRKGYFLKDWWRALRISLTVQLLAAFSVGGTFAALFGVFAYFILGFLVSATFWIAAAFYFGIWCALQVSVWQLNHGQKE